jgi:hypothetical protein
VALAAVVFIVLGLAIIVGAIVMRLRRGSPQAEPLPVRVPVAVPRRADVDFPVDAPFGVDELPDEVSIGEPVPSPSWPERVHRANGVLDDEARLRLIRDLGMLRAAWCVPILERAAEEETNPELHAAALAALAKCRRPAATSPSNGHAPTPIPEEAD